MDTPKRALAVALTAAITLAACSNPQPARTPDGKTVITAWAHSGQEPERNALEEFVSEFNGAQGDIHVDLTFLPEGTYNSQVQAAALAGDLPDLIEFDGPFVYNYVWQGHLQPLGPWLSGETRANLLSSIVDQGTYGGNLYSVGQFDSGLGLYARRSMLEGANVRIPQGTDDAWTADEFDAVLESLAAHDDDGAVLDLKLNYDGEWYTYAFSPVLWSAGMGMLSRPGYEKAAGVLDSPKSVEALTRVQQWIVNDRVDPNVDDSAFTAGRVALSWVGHWEFPRYHESFGDDLLVLPLPDFGVGSKTGQGSWNWGLSSACENATDAVKFVEYLLRDAAILTMTAGNGAVPATKSSVAASARYGEGGALALFSRQLENGAAMPRPKSPAYPVVTSAFQEAFQIIRTGGDVENALHQAAKTIDQDIADNEGYPSH